MLLQGVQLSQLHQITQIQIGRCSGDNCTPYNCTPYNCTPYNSSLRNSTP